MAFSLGILFVLQGVALRQSGGRFTKSESNYFSSIGRIQAGAKGSPAVQFLGSSITGRLPDRAQGFDGMANMGCDSGSAVDVMRAMDEGILPAAPWLVVEANTLQLALEKKNVEVDSSLRSLWFAVGLRFSCFAAYARPSGYFYSKLLQRRIGEFDTRAGTRGLGVNTLPVVCSPRSTVLRPNEEKLVQELTGIIGRLEQRGSRLMLVWLPPARPGDAPPEDWLLELAVRARIPWWDLGGDAGQGAVVLTDGVHMDAISATRTLRSLQGGISRLP